VATLQRANAVLARAQLQTQRLEPLVKADAISRQVYDDAASQRDQASADVAQAKATLERKSWI
jgi:multidrug efflux system membrane fusion protein